jgi:hypothetical protein
MAKRAVKRLGIKNSTNYYQRYKEDSRLYASPNKGYPEDWKGWVDFCGGRFYETVAEASNAVRRMGIKSSAEYEYRYKEDSRLPSTPPYTYGESWEEWGWDRFLGRS